MQGAALDKTGAGVTPLILPAPTPAPAAAPASSPGIFGLPIDAQGDRDLVEART